MLWELHVSGRTVTRSIETEAEPQAIAEILADARRIPEWAPAFADRIEAAGSNEWKVIKDGNNYSLEVVVGNAGRTVSYLREVEPGRKGGADIRVLSRPSGGSVVVMTLPVPPDRTAADVNMVLRREMDSLIQLSLAS